MWLLASKALFDSCRRVVRGRMDQLFGASGSSGRHRAPGPGAHDRGAHALRHRDHLLRGLPASAGDVLQPGREAHAAPGRREGLAVHKKHQSAAEGDVAGDSEFASQLRTLCYIYYKRRSDIPAIKRAFKAAVIKRM